MKNGNNACFLGSAGAGRFFSLFDCMVPEGEDGWYTFILKGGPGTGKSTLMKKLAAEAESHDIGCERICCSSDPDSLDAVIFPQLKACVADGTAPHEMEPVYPGADSEIIDLGFWETEKLAKSREQIIALTDKNRELHKRARGFLEIGFSVYARAAAMERTAVDGEKIERYALRLAKRSFPESGGRGKTIKRLLDAVTPGGFEFAAEYAAEKCENIIVVADRFGAASAQLVEEIKTLALGSGLDVIISPSVCGRGLKHIIIPGIGLGVFTSDCLCPVSLPGARVINASRFLDSAVMKEYKERLCFSRKASVELLNESAGLLQSAGEVHGELERIYISAIDYKKTDEAEKLLFGKIWARNWNETGNE